MIVRFENTASKESVIETISEREMLKIRETSLCTVEGVVYSVRNIIPFMSHTTILIAPLGEENHDSE